MMMKLMISSNETIWSLVVSFIHISRPYKIDNDNLNKYFYNNNVIFNYNHIIKISITIRHLLNLSIGDCYRGREIQCVSVWI